MPVILSDYGTSHLMLLYQDPIQIQQFMCLNNSSIY